MNNIEDIISGLSKYVPKRATPSIAQYLSSHPIQLTITRTRLTKMGDYRPPYKKKYHRISVNGDLNKYHFLWTLIHEIAHYEVFVKHKNTVKPHGIEWQHSFSSLVRPFIIDGVFPDHVRAVLLDHISKPTASSCSDPRIYKAFMSLNKDKSIFLDDLPDGSTFRLGNSLYQKGKKKRTRYLCTKVENEKQYLVNGIAEVELIH